MGIRRQSVPRARSRREMRGWLSRRGWRRALCETRPTLPCSQCSMTSLSCQPADSNTEPIADAANREDEAWRSQLRAQAADVRVNGPAVRAPLVVPDSGHQLFPGYHGFRRRRERVEEVELLRGDVDHLAVYPNFTCPNIQM